MYSILVFNCNYSLCSQLSDGRGFKAKARFDTDIELKYFQHGGILNYMVRKMLDWVHTLLDSCFNIQNEH